MLRHFVGATLVTLLSLLQLITALHAQIAPSQQAQQALVSPEIRTTIIKTIGALPETVEIAVSGNILTVLRQKPFQEMRNS